MTVWTTGQIIQNIQWSDTLFSLTVKAPINPFIAGQFSKIKSTICGRNVQRAYSYLNPPNSKYLMFYITKIPKGTLSHYLYQLQIGDNISLTKKSYGHFILNKIPKQSKKLWMIATGTGIAPYLSILSHGQGLEKFTHIILIHAIRFLKDSNYSYIIDKLKIKYHKQLFTQIILSQEKTPYTLTGHIQELIINGALEKKIGLQLKDKNNHIMLCGNPNMIHETQQLLKINYKIENHSNTTLKYITTERYW